MPSKRRTALTRVQFLYSLHRNFKKSEIHANSDILCSSAHTFCSRFRFLAFIFLCQTISLHHFNTVGHCHTMMIRHKHKNMHCFESNSSANRDTNITAINAFMQSLKESHRIEKFQLICDNATSSTLKQQVDDVLDIVFQPPPFPSSFDGSGGGDSTPPHVRYHQ